MKLKIENKFFFFQAEDGIRDWSVTGVQTCALPIYLGQSEALRSEATVMHCVLNQLIELGFSREQAEADRKSVV